MDCTTRGWGHSGWLDHFQSFVVETDSVQSLYSCTGNLEFSELVIERVHKQLV